MLTSKQRNERLVVLTLLGALGVNYPLLSIFSTDGFLFGIPVLYLYLFVFWGVFIAIVGLTVQGRARKEESIASSPIEDSDRHA